jgi:hypothetical protein
MMPTWAEAFWLLLAAHRLWMLWNERIAAPVRGWVTRRGPTWEYFAACPACVSVWVGGAITALWNLPGGHWLLLALALSDGILLLHQITNAHAMRTAMTQEVARRAMAPVNGGS